MKVDNAVYPTADGLRALAQDASSTPIAMLNLLKFRKKALYKDGRADDISGLEAYQSLCGRDDQDRGARGRQDIVHGPGRGPGDRRSGRAVGYRRNHGVSVAGGLPAYRDHAGSEGDRGASRGRTRGPTADHDGDPVTSGGARVAPGRGDGSAILSRWQGPRPPTAGGLNTGCRGHPCSQRAHLIESFFSFRRDGGISGAVGERNPEILERFVTLAGLRE